MLRRIVIPLILIVILFVFFVLPQYVTAMQSTDETLPPQLQQVADWAAWTQAHPWVFWVGVLGLGLYFLIGNLAWFFKQIKNR